MNEGVHSISLYTDMCDDFQIHCNFILLLVHSEISTKHTLILYHTNYNSRNE